MAACIALLSSLLAFVACSGESTSSAGNQAGAAGSDAGHDAGQAGHDAGNDAGACPYSTPESGSACAPIGMECPYGGKLSGDCFGAITATCGANGWTMSESPVSCPPFSACDAGATFGGSCSLPDFTACVVDDPACCTQIFICWKGTWGDASNPDPKCQPFCPETVPEEGTACTENPCVKAPWPNECHYPFEPCPTMSIRAQCSGGTWIVSIPFECP